MEGIECLCVADVVSFTLGSVKGTKQTNVEKLWNNNVGVDVGSFDINSVPNPINKKNYIHF